MMLALDFVTPLLLVGLSAAAIPFVLHLLSSVRAEEMYFPTLRFLRMSMEKTARRRRIQHWLLLLLRSGLLALLALAAAEPISRAAGGWLAGREYAAVVILDNSFSMAARSEAGGRFAQAKTEATALLSGETKPSVAAVMTTNGGPVPEEMTARLETLRGRIDRAEIDFGPSTLAQRVAAAVKLLKDQSAPQKSIYVFSDLQRVSFQKLAALQELAGDQDVHLLVVDTSGGRTNNVAVTDVKIAGRPVVGKVLEITATLVNSCPTQRAVDVVLDLEDRPGGQRIRKVLQAAGSEGSIAVVKFRQRFSRPGVVGGQVRLLLRDSDDLPTDDVRRFSLTISRQVPVLIVAAAAQVTDPPSLAPAWMLEVALDLFPDGAQPWSLVARTVAAEQFGPANLKDVSAAFFCNVPSFSDEQAKAVVDFVSSGGTAAIFTGLDTDVENYNLRFVDQTGAQAMLPGRLAAPVGQLGSLAEAVAVDWVDMEHPYFSGLYENLDEYLGVLVQRYHRMDDKTPTGRVLMRLANGEPLLLAGRFGQGRCVLCTTTASPRWSNLATSEADLFLPIVERISLLSHREAGQNNAYLAGSQVQLRLGGTQARPAPADGRQQEAGDPRAAKGSVLVSLPGSGPQEPPKSVSLTGSAAEPRATFGDTARLGKYRWRLQADDPDGLTASGQFVINPHGQESKLESLDAEAFKAEMAQRGIQRVYVGPTLSSANEAALADAEGRNWWDLLLAGAILLLVVEAIVANRSRTGREDAIPARLNPRIAARGAT